MAFIWRRRSSLGLALLVVSLVLTACLDEKQAVPPPHGLNPSLETVTNPDDVLRITPQDLHARLEAGEGIIVVDARASAAYRQQHIESALSIPLAELEARYQDLPKGKEIVFYCT